MELIDLITLIGGVLLTIIGWFLKETMKDLKAVKLMSYETKNQLDILKNDHTNKYGSLSDKFEDLKSALIDLTKEIKELNKRVK